MRPITWLLAILLLCGCVPVLNPEAHNVELVLNPITDRHGKKIGDVIGSAGKWYNSLFISNSALTEGALNDLRNNAYLMGSNRVYIYKNIHFTTSVTFLGEAYLSNPAP